MAGAPFLPPRSVIVVASQVREGVVAVLAGPGQLRHPACQDPLMAPVPAVLVAVGPDVQSDRQVRGDLEDWVWGVGFRPRFAVDADQAVTWLREAADAFAASLLDIRLGAQGAPTWQQVGPWVGRRLILLLREQRRTVWFEALRSGAGAVVPHPWDGAVWPRPWRWPRGVLPRSGLARAIRAASPTT